MTDKAKDNASGVEVHYYPIDEDYSIVLDAAQAVPGGRPATVKGPKACSSFWYVIDYELPLEEDYEAEFPREVIEWARRYEDYVAEFVIKAYEA